MLLLRILLISEEAAVKVLPPISPDLLEEETHAGDLSARI